MRLREFQRRLRDCPVHRDGEGNAAIVLRRDMVSMRGVLVMVASPASATRLLPQGVLHGFELAELVSRTARLLARGPATDLEHRQLAVYRRVLAPEEWATAELLAAYQPPVF